MNDERIFFTGLNGATGAPLQPYPTPNELVDIAQRADADEDAQTKRAIKTVRDRQAESRKVLGVVDGIDPLDLQQARWGVIYHPNTPAEVRARVKPLVEHRNGRVFEYQPDESWVEFRARHGHGFGDVDPDKIPYYLLIAASPEEIPFRFQYGLDADHAVGRLHFEKPEHYQGYIDSLLSHEKGDQPEAGERRIAVFAPENPDDTSTYLSRTFLAEKLIEKLAQMSLKIDDGTTIRYRVESQCGDGVEQKTFKEVLTRAEHRPAFIFTAGHGLGYPRDDPDQRDCQGALVCSSWPGPKNWPEGKRIDPEMIFSAADVPANSNLGGMVFFSFGCYTGGTPRADDFAHLTGDPPEELSKKPFVSRLAQRLLAGGALAFFGHVERCWSFSFLTPGVGEDITTFYSTMRSILRGQPLGHAFESFNRRFLSLSAQITVDEKNSALRSYLLQDGKTASDVTRLWIAHNDARSYVLLGDPFARLDPTRLPPAKEE